MRTVRPFAFPAPNIIDSIDGDAPLICRIVTAPQHVFPGEVEFNALYVDGIAGSGLNTPDDPRRYFLDWLEGDGHPFWSFFENVRSWWAIRSLPNVLMLHFAELKADLPGQIRRIAGFLDVPIDETRFPRIVERCGFAWMKANATKSVPLGGAFWDGGAETFIHRGTNGRWRDVLTAEDVARYEAQARTELGDECADWLAQ